MATQKGGHNNAESESTMRNQVGVYHYGFRLIMSSKRLLTFYEGIKSSYGLKLNNDVYLSRRPK